MSQSSRPYRIEYDIFAGLHRVAVFADAGQESLDSSLVEIQPVIEVNEVLIDGQRIELALERDQDPVLVGPPLGESREVLEDRVGIGVKQVRPESVHQNAVAVGMVVGIAGDMIAPVDDQDIAPCAGQPLGDHRSRKARSDNQHVLIRGHRAHGCAPSASHAANGRVDVFWGSGRSVQSALSAMDWTG